MTFIVETFVKPNDLIKPDSLAKMLNINYTQLLIDATNEINTNSSNFLSLKRKANTLILSLFDAYTQLQADSARLADNLTNIKEQLDTLKINNVSLKAELAHMNEISDGSSELINNYKELYNINYTRNWGILLSIIFSCYVMSTMFKSKPITL
jgi:hypothetical protein